MTYDDPYCDAKFVSVDGTDFGFYYVLTDAEKDVLSSAAHDVVSDVVSKWLQRPGMLECRLHVEDEELGIYLNEFDNDGFASFTLPLRDVILSAANTATEWSDYTPSDVSAMLRKLANEIDAQEQAA